MGLESGLTRYLVAVTSSCLYVLNNSHQSEEDDKIKDDTGDTEDGEWDDYSLDS